MTADKRPLKLEHAAVLVVDMLNEFITGALACERGKAIVPATAKLLDAARKAGKPVIFCNDSHLPGIDHELKLWGNHAMRGSEGAEVIPELQPCTVADNHLDCNPPADRYVSKTPGTDYTILKRRYSGFCQTGLDMLLKELGADTVIITGVQTHICVQHTAADAFMLGYDVVVAKEATDAFSSEALQSSLDYMKTCYGADAYSNEELIAAL